LPQKVISQINNLFFQYTESDKFITLFYGNLNYKDGNIIYCNAGHNYPFIFREKKCFYELQSCGLPCGVRKDIPYRDSTIQIQPGDLALFYTDGITEAMNSNGVMFGEERLKKIVAEVSHLNSVDIVNIVREELENFVGGIPQFDDLTLLVLKLQ